MAAFSFRPQPALDLRRREEDAAQLVVRSARDFDRAAQALADAQAPSTRGSARAAALDADGGVDHRRDLASELDSVLRRELVRTEASAEDRRVQLEAAEQALVAARRTRQGARAIEGAGRRGAPGTGAARRAARPSTNWPPCASRSAKGESHRERHQHRRRRQAADRRRRRARTASRESRPRPGRVPEAAHDAARATRTRSSPRRTASSSRSWRSSARSRSSPRSRRRSRSWPPPSRRSPGADGRQHAGDVDRHRN